MRKVVAIALAFMLVIGFTLPVVAYAEDGKPIPPAKGKIQTSIFVHYEKGKGPPPGKGPDKGKGGEDKVLDYYELLGPSWTSLPVSYTIDPTFSPVDPSAGTGEIKAAFEAWDDVVTSELFALPVVSAVVVDFEDTVNTVSWRILAGYPKAIAVTALRWQDNDDNGQMSTGDEFVAFDVVLNLMQKWAIDPDGEGPQKPDAKGKWFDVRGITTHEAGHVVGLADLYDDVYSELTMYGYSSPHEVKKISLEVGDIAGAAALH